MSMDWFADTIEAFGAAAGFDALAPDAEGRVRFSMGDGGGVEIARLSPDDDSDVLLRVFLPPGDGLARARSALERADFRRMRDWQVRVALVGVRLALAVHVRRRSFVRSELEAAMAVLFRVREECLQVN
jgi:hypothetical protein